MGRWRLEQDTANTREYDKYPVHGSQKRLMPARRQQITCKNCGVRIFITRRTRTPSKKRRKAKKKVRRPKSAARVARGKFLAANLPRDEKGKFLPAGSVNRFRGKRPSTSLGFGTLPPIKRRAPQVDSQLLDTRTRFPGVTDFLPSIGAIGSLAVESAAQIAQRAAAATAEGIFQAARGRLSLPQ